MGVGCGSGVWGVGVGCGVWEWGVGYEVWGVGCWVLGVGCGMWGVGVGLTHQLLWTHVVEDPLCVLAVSPTLHNGQQQEGRIVLPQQQTRHHTPMVI